MESSARMRNRPSEVGNRELVVALDLAVEATRSALAAAVLVARGAEKVGRPFLRVVLRPPVVSPAYWPETWLRDLSHRGDRRRVEALRSLSDLLDSLVPILAQEVLTRIDLTEVVRRYVDLDAIVAGVDLDAAAARLDVTAVIDRIDLVGIAEDVIEQLDLPEIIRESTGSMASDTIREVRMQGISGDEAVTRAIDRLRLRKSRRGAHATVTGPSAD